MSKKSKNLFHIKEQTLIAKIKYTVKNTWIQIASINKN